MKRLTKQKLKQEFERAKLKLDDYWNDVEIRLDSTYYGNHFTNSVDDALEVWKDIGYENYKHIGVTLNHIDKNGDIQDIDYTFEYETGI